jgi:hypothetical protein
MIRLVRQSMWQSFCSWILAASLLLVSFSALTSCERRNFTNDPVKWSFVSGDGTWDAKSRNWTVYIGTDETKTMTLELNNTGTEDIMVLIQMGAPDTIGLHLERSSSVLLGGNGIGVLTGKSAQLTVTATARVNFGRPNRFIIDFGWSTNEPMPVS